MIETTTSDAVLARLEALTERLDRLEAENAALKAENARRTAAESSDILSVVEPVAGMAESSAARRQGDRRPSGAGILKRRGLLAGVAALLGAGLAKLDPAGRAEATHTAGGTANADSNAIHMALDNAATQDVKIYNGSFTGSSDGNRVTFLGDRSSQVVLTSRQTGGDARFAVLGRLGTFSGSSGLSIPTNIPIAGVWGVNDNALTAAGVLGESKPVGFGVKGLTTNGFGVYGETQGGIGVQGTGQTGPGVYGVSISNAGVQGTSTTNAGVYGSGPLGVFATGTGTAAVYAVSNGTYGVWGSSGGSAGLIGTSTNYIGVQALSTSHWGLHAKSPTYAGVFEGNVFVTGQVIALGGVFGASAQAAGGSDARALAEDVGEATLTNGKATVTLAEGFVAASGGDYRVFLTELADLGGLYVAQKGPRQFEVRSRGGTGQAAAHGRFDYRVVAKTAPPAGTRQAPLALPDLTTVKPTPKPPEPPKVPESSGASEERRRP